MESVRLERERLAAEEVKRIELERLERDRVERERMLAEQRRKQQKEEEERVSKTISIAVQLRQYHASAHHVKVNTVYISIFVLILLFTFVTHH